MTKISPKKDKAEGQKIFLTILAIGIALILLMYFAFSSRT